jgi:hypothetical protein
MAKRTAPVAPVTAAPISPEAAAANALDTLILNTFAYLKLTERRREDARRDIRDYAERLARRYSEMAERATEDASPSSFDLSLAASNTTQLNTAAANYQIQTDLLDEQRRLLKRLLACSTVPQPDQITNAAAL